MVSTRWTDAIGTRKLPRCWHVTNFWNEVEIIALRLVLTVVHKIVVTRRMPAGLHILLAPSGDTATLAAGK